MPGDIGGRSDSGAIESEVFVSNIFGLISGASCVDLVVSFVWQKLLLTTALGAQLIF